MVWFAGGSRFETRWVTSKQGIRKQWAEVGAVVTLLRAPPRGRQPGLLAIMHVENFVGHPWSEVTADCVEEKWAGANNSTQNGLKSALVTKSVLQVAS